MAVSKFLLAKGCIHSEDAFIQKFDPENDEEEFIPGGISSGRKVAGFVQNVGRNQIISAAVGVATRANVPGFVFGVGSLVAGKVSKRIRKKKVSEVGCKVSVEVLRVADLPNIRAKRQTVIGMSPYVSVQLVMDGCEHGSDEFKARTRAMSGGGTSCSFPPNSKACVGLPLDDPTAVANACLYVEVKDEPDLGFIGESLRETLIGCAMVSLNPLVCALSEDVKIVDSPVNLHLYTQAELSDPNMSPSGGVVRLHISIEVLADVVALQTETSLARTPTVENWLASGPTDKVPSVDDWLAANPADETSLAAKPLDEASLATPPVDAALPAERSMDKVSLPVTPTDLDPAAAMLTDEALRAVKS